MAKIALAVVHPGQVAYDWHHSVVKSLSTGGHSYRLISVESGPLISRSRNQVLRLFLESDADYLLFTDSDVVWEPEVVDQLLASDQPIVGALIIGHGNQGEFLPIVTVKIDGEFLRPDMSILKDWQEQNLANPTIEVLGIGMGMTLIKREVIEALAPIKELFPYAEVMWGKKPVGEDVAFCLRAAKKGFRSFLRLDARVGHRKTVLL